MKTNYFSDTSDTPDWKLLDFLKFRQKEESWTANKQKEYYTYISTLRRMVKTDKGKSVASALETYEAGAVDDLSCSDADAYNHVSTRLNDLNNRSMFNMDCSALSQVNSQEVKKFWEDRDAETFLANLDTAFTIERTLEHNDYINEVGQQRKNLLKKRTKEREEAKCSTKKPRDSASIDYSDLSETDLSDLGHEEKRENGKSDDSDYEPSNHSTSSSYSEHIIRRKKQKISKGKLPEVKVTVRYDNGNASSLNSMSNNVIISQDSSNQEQLPTVIVTNPTTQIPRTPSPRPNVSNIQVTPQKSVLFKESVTYLQNHIRLNVNDQGMIIKDNDTSVEISSIIRNWLVTVLSSSKEDFIKAIMTPLSPLKRNIGERTFIVERIVPLFKAIQSIYNEYKFHWIEIELDCMREVKKIFPKFNLTINQADGLGIRNSSNKAVMFIEVSGGPENTDPKHVKEDSEKLLKELIFGLVSLLRNYLDKSAEKSKNLYTFMIQSIGDRLTLSKLCLTSKHVYKVSQIKSATLPFEFIDVAEFLAVFELLYVLVSELEIQTGVINKLRLSESVDGIIVPRIRDWIWLPDSVSTWECKEIQNENS
ncbi:1378_t:CDS:10 [Diversispora eburnea]|uniref:1378_t:CDS:1 n=1 Tax=Diversispora eburnea TaxID=1213867 RepID=A0A9N9CMA8_9GLOM|nr:1378_t:CDS:10 [Diversispora eburnea]